MSAAALKGLASAAAATLCDAIGRAQTSADLDALAKSLWHSHLVDGSISEADAEELFGYIDSQRRRPKRAPRQMALPGLPSPDRNRDRVSIFPKRRVQGPKRGSQDEQERGRRQASYGRRHRLAYSGVMPHHLAARMTVADMAVMRIVADEYRTRGVCDLSRDEIAARAGVHRETVRLAMNKALGKPVKKDREDERGPVLISVEERPVPGRKHRTNLVRIISFEWLKWLRHPNEKAVRSGEPIGAKIDCPTVNRLEDDCGNDANCTAAPAPAARPERGRPTKEAFEFATELANIAGYRQAAVPIAWRDADPPQVVQVWLNELGGKMRPIEALRAIATTVMRRKRSLGDASPPCSPRYFSAEVKKLVARSRLQPRRDPARRVA